MAFEIVVAVEALRALIATEWSVGLRVWLCDGVSVDAHGSMSTGVVHWHALGHAVDKCELTIRIANVGENGTKWWGIAKRTLLVSRCLGVKGRNVPVTVDGRRPWHSTTSATRALHHGRRSSRVREGRMLWRRGRLRATVVDWCGWRPGKGIL